MRDEEPGTLSLPNLNAQFYSHYPCAYFSSSLMALLSTYHDPKGIVASIEDAYISFGDGENALRVGFQPSEAETSEMREAAKLEIVSLYYHCLETDVHNRPRHQTPRRMTRLLEPDIWLEGESTVL